MDQIPTDGTALFDLARFLPDPQHGNTSGAVPDLSRNYKNVGGA